MTFWAGTWEGGRAPSVHESSWVKLCWAGRPGKWGHTSSIFCANYSSSQLGGVSAPRLSVKGSWCRPLQLHQLQGKTEEEAASRQRKPPPGLVVYSNSLCSFIKPSLRQNMSAERENSVRSYQRSSQLTACRAQPEFQQSNQQNVSPLPLRRS